LLARGSQSKKTSAAAESKIADACAHLFAELLSPLGDQFICKRPAGIDVLPDHLLRPPDALLLRLDAKRLAIVEKISESPSSTPSGSRNSLGRTTLPPSSILALTSRTDRVIRAIFDLFVIISKIVISNKSAN
jgi:hypothetical protein